MEEKKEKKKRKSSKPRKLGKLSLMKKELKMDRTKGKRLAEKAESELAQIEKRRSRRLTWQERN